SSNGRPSTRTRFESNQELAKFHRPDHEPSTQPSPFLTSQRQRGRAGRLRRRSRLWLSLSDEPFEAIGGRMRYGDHANGYVILDKIGEGGMSTVYLARDPEHRNKVVVKHLKEQLATDAEFVARFRQAATIMRQLHHPNLASVMDYIEQDGNCLVVEEYLPGG